MICIEPFHGPRSLLLPLFAEADDSPLQILAYIDLGEVLVARRAGQMIGHVQLLGEGVHREIRSVAVVEPDRRRGVGRALVMAALDRAFSSGARTVAVATAAADIGNLRFYQRLGFRMDRVERDAFTAARGYPEASIDGIPLRDRVWLAIDASARRHV